MKKLLLFTLSFVTCTTFAMEHGEASSEKQEGVYGLVIMAPKFTAQAPVRISQETIDIKLFNQAVGIPQSYEMGEGQTINTSVIIASGPKKIVGLTAKNGCAMRVTLLKHYQKVVV